MTTALSVRGLHSPLQPSVSAKISLYDTTFLKVTALAVVTILFLYFSFAHIETKPRPVLALSGHVKGKVEMSDTLDLFCAIRCSFSVIVSFSSSAIFNNQINVTV